MPSLEAQIEALLAIAPRPLNVKKLAELTEAKPGDVREAVAALAERLRIGDGGVAVVTVGDEVRLSTKPELTALAEKYVKDETAGELTRPQLEALTVIAYRGPVSKPEIEQIRGVNCTIIIRNLLMRGLIDEAEDNGAAAYQVSMDFMKFLGIASVAELPDYATLSRDKRIEDILAAAEEKSV